MLFYARSTNPTTVFIANSDIMTLINVDNGRAKRTGAQFIKLLFGVQRSKDGDNLCVRNKMTGRIFFLRYPQLYDFMLVSALFVRMNVGHSASIILCT